MSVRSLAHTALVLVLTANCASPGETPSRDDLASTSSPAVVTSKERVKSESLSTTLFDLTPITCPDGSEGTLSAFATLSATRDVVNNSTTSQASVSLRQVNTCTLAIFDVSTTVLNPDYKQTGAKSATLNVSFELFDTATGTFVGLLDVAVSFDAVPTTSRQNCGVFTEVPGDLTIHQHQKLLFSEAVPSGTITLNGAELIDGVISSVLLMDQSKTMAVQH